MEKEHGPLGQEQIMQMLTGFWVSKTVFCGMELEIFEELAKEPMEVEGLAKKLNLHSNSLERLLVALTALGLLEKRGEGFIDSEVTKTYLLKSSHNSMAGLWGHFNNDLYPLWMYLPDAVREGTARWKQAFGPNVSQNPFETIYKDPDKLLAFLKAMSGMAGKTAQQICDKFDFSSFKCLMDVGGALGSMLIAVLGRVNHLNGILFDLPPVIPLAQQHIESEGFKDRIKAVGGDVFAQDLPQGADLISLGWVLHDWDDEMCLKILKNCYQALPSGGGVLIIEKVISDDKTGPLPAALMALNMLVVTLNGRERTGKEYGKLLAEAGFVEPHVEVIPGPRDYVFARKP
jgi:acetylserotonin O-methyltransferase